MNLTHLRNDTPGTQHHIHLNNAGASLQPTPVMDAIRSYLEEEFLHGGYETRAARRKEIAKFYSVTAELLNTAARNIAFTAHATESFNKALSAIPFERGDVLLTTDDDYVSSQIAFLYLQKRFGVQIVRAGKLPEGGVDPDSVKALMEKHNPKLVAVAHVPTNSGLVQDVEAVGKLCRERDTWYLVDACQSAGQIPLDVESVGCDFLSATMRKWMRGPRGAGFLYVGDRVIDAGLEPMYPDMNDGTWTDDFAYELHPTARYFEYWEKNYALMMGSKAAVEYALEVGVEKIEKRVGELADYAREQLLALPGWKVLDQGSKKCGIVTAHNESKKPAHLSRALKKANINVGFTTKESAVIDFREKEVEWVMRVSPHYYNTAEEVDALVECINEN